MLSSRLRKSVNDICHIHLLYSMLGNSVDGDVKGTRAMSQSLLEVLH